MATEERAPRIARQIWFSLGGIAAGVLFAGLIALFINNVIQPTMQIETQGLVAYNGERFNLWFHEDSELPSQRNALFRDLERSLDELLALLDVDESSIPLPIDVIVHDTPDELQSSILRRKSAGATYTFYSMLDVVYGEDPYERLCELVLAFGWGRSWSQLLYTGALLNLTQPDRDFHVAVAAAPERLRCSLTDLTHLESTGLFPETLYQAYDSPYSPRMAIGTLDRLVSFYSMFDSVGAGETESEHTLVELYAASIVQYLVETTGGWSAIRDAWGPGTTEAVLSSIVREPITELTTHWLESAASHTTDSEEFEYLHARFLFEAGDCQGAYDIAKTWSPRESDGNRLQLALKAALAVGDFERARRLNDTSGHTYSDWISIYEGWSVQDDDRVRLLVAPGVSDPDLTVSAVERDVDEVGERLSLPADELPGRVSIFVYETEEARNAGASILSVEPQHQTFWHIVPSENILELLAGGLPSYAFNRHTASSLLRSGTAAALANDLESLRSRGCDMYLAGEWTSLWRLGFGGTPTRLLDVEAGLMVHYILEIYGPSALRELWTLTSRAGSGMSLDTALGTTVGTSRHDIDQALLGSVLQCGG